VTVGRFGKAHGLAGELRLEALGGPGDALRRTPWIFVGLSQINARRMRVEGIRGRAGRMIVKIEGIDTPEAVRRLAGSLLFVRRSDFPPTGEGEYYWVDLIGLRVRTTEGEALGVVEEIIGTAAFDVLVARHDDVRSGSPGESLIPLRKDVLYEVQAETGVLVVAPRGAWEAADEDG
jgi:16S rRNA processing protein RimM